MSDNLQKYMPEYDDEETRQKLAGFSREALIELLLRSYKEKRLILKLLDEKLRVISAAQEALSAPSKLLSMPDVPSAEDLRRMMTEE